ncbi:unnamed protein product [Cunninghamella blakesleeana]
MDEINRLLEKTKLDKQTELTIVSIFGCTQINGKPENKHYSNVEIANSIVGKEVFVANNEQEIDGTILLIDDLQFYVDKEKKIGYQFIDSTIDMKTLASTLYMYTNSGSTSGTETRSSNKTMQNIMLHHQSSTTRAFLIMFLTSHLIIPILPSTLLSQEILSALITLHQAKQGIYTHLAQFITQCWKHWDISVPHSIFEKKDAENRRERERLNAQVTGWWGPAKGVPLIIFIVNNIYIPNVENTNRTTLPVFLKKLHESLQVKLKTIFHSVRLIPSSNDNNSSNSNQYQQQIEFKSLFCLPTNQQHPYFIHAIPSIPPSIESAILAKSKKPPPNQINIEKKDSNDMSSLLNEIQQWMNNNDSATLFNEKKDESSSFTPSNSKEITNKHQVGLILQDYRHKLLNQFVNHWIKTAQSRNPMHVQVLASSIHKRNPDIKHTNVPLPTSLQFFSALVPLISLIYGIRFGEGNIEDFIRKAIMVDNKSTKGMVQQIEVILKKKVKNALEIEKVFSRSHSIDVMQKCLDVYQQDLPPYYTQQYHINKRENILRLYKTLSRGPLAIDFGLKLERECDFIWKQGRQSCEAISLTRKVCRLKLGHDNKEEKVNNEIHYDDIKYEDQLLNDSTKHNSGYTFTHACTCGKSQMARDDPFDIKEANYGFYKNFNCCLSFDERRAVDLNKSQFKKDQQELVLQKDTIPENDAALLYLGPASIYRNTIGLDRYEGFTANTNYLLPWNLTTVTELQTRLSASKIEVEENLKQEQALNIEWPELGKNSKINNNNNGKVILGKSNTTSTSILPNNNPLSEAFPSLESSKTAPIIPIPNPQPSTKEQQQQQQPIVEKPKVGKDERRRERRRHERRLEGQIRGFLGAEYECPRGHRFLSCGDGRVCKLGHKGHPKQHGNYFIHQDIPLYALCPCNFADYNIKTSTKLNTNIIAQLLRIYVVTPDADVSISMNPNIKIHLPETDETIEYNFGIENPFMIPRNSMYVLRLPFIYRHPNTQQIIDLDIEKKLRHAIFEKGCFELHFPK